MTHPVTEDIVAPATRHRGISFLRFRRRYLAFGAMAFAGVMTTMPTLPASAEVMQEEAIVATVKVLRVGYTAQMPTVERGDYSISYFSVVQAPLPPGARTGKPFSGGHQGIDFLPGAGTPVLAIADGVVTEVGNPEGALGVHVTIQHTIDGETVFSTYGHMAMGSMSLSVGQAVLRGQQLGRVGATGVATGPHLHFQILLANGTAISPLPWLSKHINV